MPLMPLMRSLTAAPLSPPSLLIAPLARWSSDGSSEMSTDCVAFFDRAEKSGSCNRPGSAAAASAGSASSAQVRIRDRSRMAVSREKCRESSRRTGSGVRVLLAGDGGAHDVDVVAGYAQRLQELSSA